MIIYDIDGNAVFDTQNSGKEALSANLRSTAYLKQLLSESDGTMQGACTDGTFIYYVYYSTNTLKKYNIETGEVISKSYTSGLYVISFA